MVKKYQRLYNWQQALTVQLAQLGERWLSTAVSQVRSHVGIWDGYGHKVGLGVFPRSLIQTQVFCINTAHISSSEIRAYKPWNKATRCVWAVLVSMPGYQNAFCKSKIKETCPFPSCFGKILILYRWPKHSNTLIPKCVSSTEMKTTNKHTKTLTFVLSVCYVRNLHGFCSLQKHTSPPALTKSHCCMDKLSHV